VRAALTCHSPQRSPLSLASSSASDSRTCWEQKKHRDNDNCICHIVYTVYIQNTYTRYIQNNTQAMELYGTMMNIFSEEGPPTAVLEPRLLACMRGWGVIMG
jgi:hypothetical protein